MKVEWLYEAKQEYLALLRYHMNQVSSSSAHSFAELILSSVENLAVFPESGVLRTDTAMGRLGFRALFIGKYACIYRVTEDTVLIYHLVDARTNYIYRIFGIEE